MTSNINDFCVIEDSLKDNPSIKRFIEMIGSVYHMDNFTKAETLESPPLMYLGQISNDILGFWPAVDSVKAITMNKTFTRLLGNGTINVVVAYDHDKDGNQMMSLKLTHDINRLKKYGLENLIPGQDIYIYCRPKQ